MEKPAEKDCLSEAHILPFISKICRWGDERERKEWTESEIYVQHATFLQMLCFPSYFIMAYVFALLITELYPNIFLSESEIQAIDP